MKKFFVTIVLCVSIVFYLWAQPKKPAQTQPKKPASAQAKTAGVTQASTERGRQLYLQICAACHQKDGGGVPRLNPPLIKTDYVAGDKTRLIRIVLKGLNEPIEIDGEEYTNAMPGQPHLTNQQIADVLTFVRSNFGNKASAITPAEVKAVRAKT